MNLRLCFAEQGKAPSFRLDKQALEATTTRQLQVWAGHVTRVQDLGSQPSRYIYQDRLVKR